MNLKPQQLSSEWTKPEGLRPVYYLVGEERLSKYEAVDRLKKLLNPDTFNLLETSFGADSARNIIQTSLTPPVFAGIRLVIARSCEKITAGDREALCEYILNPVESTCLILISDTRRTKEDKIALAADKKGAVVAYWPLSNDEAVNWIEQRFKKNGKTISPEASAMMVEALGTDTGVLAAETEKLLLYSKDSKDSVTLKTAAESIGFSKSESPYELGRAILKKNAAEAALLLDRMISSGEEPIRLLHIISGSVVKLIKTRRLLEQGAGPDRIFKDTGSSSYFDRDLPLWAKLHRDDERLMKVMRMCLETEAMFKSSSGKDSGISLRYLLFEIFGKETTKTPR